MYVSSKPLATINECYTDYTVCAYVCDCVTVSLYVCVCLSVHYHLARNDQEGELVTYF